MGLDTILLLEEPPLSENYTINIFQSEGEELVEKNKTLVEAQKEANMPIWLCGGDSGIFFDHLKNRKIPIFDFCVIDCFLMF